MLEQLEKNIEIKIFIIEINYLLRSGATRILLAKLISDKPPDVIYSNCVGHTTRM